MPAKPVLIKKYENRRLYDTTNSRYINLEEVADFVRRGYDVRVADAVSGEDITRVILTQIIAEGAKTPDSSFPLDILRQMVIASGRASQEGALRYMQAMLDLYQSTYRAIAPALNPFEFLQKASPTGKRDSDGFGGASGPSETDVNSAGLEDMNRLKERVAELERHIASKSAPAAPRSKTRRKLSNRRKS